MAVIEDYDHMNTTDKNMEWMQLTDILSIFYLNLSGPFCTSTCTSSKLNNLSDVHTRGKKKKTHTHYTSPLCILCTLTPRIVPLLALMLVRAPYEESTSPRNLGWRSHSIMSPNFIGSLNSHTHLALIMELYSVGTHTHTLYEVNNDRT